MPLWLRTRSGYVALALATIALGLASHFHGAALGPGARDVIGDALWAMMMAWWIAAVAPAARLLSRSAVALAVCFVVEGSQLYHAPALDALRETTPGHLILGSDFDPRDLAAYTVGVIAAALIDRAVMTR